MIHLSCTLLWKFTDNVTGIHAEPDLGQIYEFETRYGEILKRATDEYVLSSKYYRDGFNKVLTVQTEPQAIRTIKTFSSVWLTARSPSNFVWSNTTLNACSPAAKDRCPDLQTHSPYWYRLSCSPTSCRCLQCSKCYQRWWHKLSLLYRHPLTYPLQSMLHRELWYLDLLLRSLIRPQYLSLLSFCYLFY